MTRGPMITWCGRFRARIAGLLLGTAVLAGLMDPAAFALTGFRTSGVAWAEPANVEALIRRGNLLRQQGKDISALPFYQKAYETERNPRTAAQLGLVEAALGYWLASERHLSEALSSNRHPWVERMRDQLGTTLKTVSDRIGEVEVTGSPSGAEVLVNNKVVGTLPLQAVRVEEGTAQILVRSPGFIEHNANLTITGGRRQSLAVNLPQAGEGPNAGVPPKVAQEDRGPALGQNDLVHETVRDEAPGRKSGAPVWVRPMSWVAGALAATALGIGTYQLLEMRKNEDLFNQHTAPGSRTFDCARRLPDRGGTECARLYEKASSAQKLALVGFQVGGVLAVASVIGFIWSSNSSTESTSATLTTVPDFRLALDPSGASAGLNWRF